MAEGQGGSRGRGGGGGGGGGGGEGGRGGRGRRRGGGGRSGQHLRLGRGQLRSRGKMSLHLAPASGFPPLLAMEAPMGVALHQGQVLQPIVQRPSQPMVNMDLGGHSAPVQVLPELPVEEDALRARGCETHITLGMHSKHYLLPSNYWQKLHSGFPTITQRGSACTVEVGGPRPPNPPSACTSPPNTWKRFSGEQHLLGLSVNLTTPKLQQPF